MTRTTRAAVVVTMAVASMGVVGSAADASTLAVHGCLGASISVQAPASNGGPFGSLVSAIAHAPGKPGVADAIQMLQAGVVPDSTFTDTCNGTTP